MTIKNYVKNAIIGLSAAFLASGCAITIKSAYSPKTQDCWYDTDGDGKLDLRISSRERDCRDIRVFVEKKETLKEQTEEAKKELAKGVDQMLGIKQTCVDLHPEDDENYCRSIGEEIVDEAHEECIENPASYGRCMQRKIKSAVEKWRDNMDKIFSKPPLEKQEPDYNLSDKYKSAKKETAKAINDFFRVRKDPAEEARCLERIASNPLDPTDPVYCQSIGEIIVEEAHVECKDDPEYVKCMEESIIEGIQAEQKRLADQKIDRYGPTAEQHLTPRQKKGFARMEHESQLKKDAEELCQDSIFEPVEDCVRDLVQEGMREYDIKNNTPRRDILPPLPARTIL